MFKTQWNEQYYVPPARAPRVEYATTREAVLAAMGVGARSVAEICGTVGLTRSAVAKQLLKMAEQGLVRRARCRDACGKPQEWELA